MQPDRFGSSTQPIASSLDAGLRSHMNRIYNRMCLGVLVTGLVAFAVSLSPQLMALIFGTPLKWVVMLAPLAVVFFGFNPERMSSDKLRISFLFLSVLYGLSFATIFAVFSAESIAKAFFITAGAFAGLSIFGYTTKKNLDGLGSFAVMGVIGALILGLVNLFVQSSMLMNIVSVISLLAFAGITAFQTQQMKEMYSPAHGEEANSRMSWMAALNLYISFIAMFQSILSLMNQR
jgi:uncharacterized protein